MNYVLITSGGLDSTTLLYAAKSEGHTIKALCFDYGQRHRKELYAAQKVAEKTKTPFEIVRLANLRNLIAGSSQTSDDIEVPEGHYASENMKLTVVPNRNMIMLSIAAGHAISLNYDGVGYAAHAGDHAIYPDCRPQFVSAMASVLSLVDYKPIHMYTPFITLRKQDIVGLGKSLGVPFEDTWSCYKGQSLHCGKCGTCVERKEAFKLAGVDDPTRYEA